MSKIIPLPDVQKALIRDSFDSEGLPMPYVREIFLMQCHVAGTGFRDLKEIEPDLRAGDLLTFRREPDNVHDRLAIEIFSESDMSLGYVPRNRNEVLARLMDAGKLVFGRVESPRRIEDWLRIEIMVYMRDF